MNRVNQLDVQNAETNELERYINFGITIEHHNLVFATKRRQRYQ